MSTIKLNGAVVNLKWAYGKNGYPDLKPNETLCEVSLERNGETKVGLGMAWKSENDLFEKEEARKRSLARALKENGFTREERTIVYEAYFGRK